MDDQDLVKAARGGDRAALAALVDRHYASLEQSCRRMLGDAELARDAAQEAVLRALLGLELLRDERRFGAWLVGIGLNVCRGWISRSARRRSSLEAVEDSRGLGAPEAAIDPLEAVASAELGSRVRAAIAALPAGQRHAVALFYLDGLTRAEIAEDLGTRASAVKTRLQKARASLRVSLRDTYKEHIDMTEKSSAEESPELIAMRVAELRRTTAAEPGTERHIMFLEDDRGAGTRLREIRITELTSSVFYAQAILSDGTVVDARPSDAITLALVAGVPIYVSTAVLAKADENRAPLRPLLSEAEAATDNARVIVDEFRARHAAEIAVLSAHEATPKSDSAAE